MNIYFLTFERYLSIFHPVIHRLYVTKTGIGMCLLRCYVCDYCRPGLDNHLSESPQGTQCCNSLARSRI